MNAVLMMMVALAGQQANVPLFDVVRDVFAVTDKAYLVLPPQSVCDDVREMQWSPAGKSLLFRTMDNQPEVDAALGELSGQQVPVRVPSSQVGVYSMQTGKTRMYSGLPQDTMIGSLQWTSETSAVVEAMQVNLNEPEASATRLYLLTTSGSRLVSLGDNLLAPNERLRIISDPSTAVTFLVVYRYLEEGRTKIVSAHELSASGQLLAARGSVTEAIAQGWAPQFALPGKGIAFSNFNTGRVVYQLLTPKMVFEPWTPPQDRNVFETDAPAVLQHARAELGDMLYLLPKERKAEDKEGTAPVMICQQVEAAELSPAFNAVAYTSQRMLWVRPIQPIDLAIYQKAIDAKRRMDAMMRAKQIGTAMMIFAVDNDDKFPDGDPISALSPYVKNPDLFKGFVFTFPSGKSINDIEKPAETEIGHIPMPGGRIVTYADSHVKWVPDK